MTWLFSRALMQSYENSRCSRALVAASLPATCLDGALSAPLSVMPTQHKFWRNDKTMEPSDLSRFGLTCAVLTADRGADLLTWCLEASRARTSVWPARAQALKAPAAECGTTWRGSLARFDPASSTWRTAQPSLLGDSDECSVTWPRSGMTAGGQCWELPTLAPPISATGFGLLLPTLTVCGNNNRKGASPTSGDGLATAILKMPTLCARDYRSPGRSRLERTGGSQGEVLPQAVGGPLNPTWCEWFMGFPQGWTELGRWATPKSPSAPQPRGECSLVA